MVKAMVKAMVNSISSIPTGYCEGQKYKHSKHK